MAVPDIQMEFSPEQIAEINQKLSVMRHNVNNHLALVVAAAELIRRKPEMAQRLIENILKQPEPISREMRLFSESFESIFGIARKPTTPQFLQSL